MKLTDLSDEELVSNLHALVGRTRTVLAYLLEYLGEVEERRIDLKSACSSMFDFCVRRLGMSDDEACRRVAAARLVRRFPIALGMIERGEIHLTTLLLLREHLDEGNHEELLRQAAGKTKMQVQELIAARSPRPDAPSAIVPLPAPSAASTHATPSLPSLRLEPLAPERYKVQFTASAELRDKIERATDLMRHANPSGDIAVMVERAVEL